jgi:broad specificity phosphatase PhoE
VKNGETVLVAAHGNSLRSIVMDLDKLTKEQVLELNLDTGVPIVYDLDERGRCWEENPEVILGLPLFRRRPIHGQRQKEGLFLNICSASGIHFSKSRMRVSWLGWVDKKLGRAWPLEADSIRFQKARASRGS